MSSSGSLMLSAILLCFSFNGKTSYKLKVFYFKIDIIR